MPDKTQRIQRLECIFNAFVELDRFYAEATSLEEYMERAHNLLRALMQAESFYLASYNRQENTVQFIYNRDEKDDSIPPDRKFTLAPVELSPTSWVITNKQRLLLNKRECSEYVHEQQKQANYQLSTSTCAEHWLGVPLVANTGFCLGALVIQSYMPERGYSEEDQSIFRLFASVVASALDKFRIESAIQADLADTHQALSAELVQRRHSEKLQRALYELATLATKAPELSEFYPQVHEIVDSLIYAKNFYVALVDEEQHEMKLVYFVDEIDSEVTSGTVLPIGQGLTSYVLSTRKPQLLVPREVDNLRNEGKIGEVKGNQSYTCWLGVPMISSNILHGIMVVQSYDEKIIFTQDDLKLMHFIANHIASAIEATNNVQQRKEAQLKLARQHRVLEQQHKEMLATIEKLKRTQQQLVQQEKMASLGGLVAGIAHEINTPLGICVTGISHLHDETQFLEKSLADSTLSEDDLVSYLNEVKEASKILDTNIQKAADLVKSFKQVAVDQSSNTVREIRIKQYIDEILLSMRPTLKRVKHNIKVVCDDTYTTVTNAGAISQILSNLIMNSIKHGFEGIEQGNIAIFVEQKGDFTIIRYADDGIGLDDAAMNMLFEPFYTTKRGSGGSGLGTHLVYNLATSALGGRIEAKSELGKGLAYLIKFPTHLE